MATAEETRPDCGDDLDPCLSVAAVARRLGVAPSTLRTWDRRYGLGPSSHQAGSHRRYAPADLERLIVMRRLTLEGVRPAEAARVAMTAPSGWAVRQQRSAPAARPGPPAAPAALSTWPRRSAGPGIPPGVVALPIADPPPRGRPIVLRVGAPGPATAATAATAAAASAASAATATAATATAATTLVAAASSAGLALAPEPPDLTAVLQVPAELGLPRPQDGSDDARDRVRVGEAGGARCGGGRVLALADATPQARGLARAAMALDSPEIWRLLSQAIAAQGVVATWNRLALPVLQAVGERWLVTGEGVDVEHLFSETLVDVLRSVVVRHRPAPRVSPLLLACLEKEHHTLALHALAAALAERGIGCRLLGGGLPPSSLVTAVRRTGPALVFLFARMPVGDLSTLVELPRQRPAPRLVFGGPGWDCARAQVATARPAGLPQGSRVRSLPEAVDAVLAVLRG
jgi:hypothetical protein